MKIKEFKFEDIAYYIDNWKPFLKDKIEQLDDYTVVYENQKKFTFISINILYFSFFLFLIIPMCKMNFSFTFIITISILILFVAIYLNSKILYAFNNRKKINNNLYLEIKENYNEKFRFNSFLINKINNVNSDLNLKEKTDLAVLFLYVQHFVLKERISNSEIIRQINNTFEFERFSEAHYSKIANNLFEWKDENVKKKVVKDTLKYSSHLEKFKEIEDNFKDFIK